MNSQSRASQSHPTQKTYSLGKGIRTYLITVPINAVPKIPINVQTCALVEPLRSLTSSFKVLTSDSNRACPTSNLVNHSSILLNF